ncbi:hypothetical protein ACI65C_003891 [Semiaphis heraclei]
MEREDNAKETLTTFVNKIVEKAAEINQLKSEILELEKSKETQAVPPPVATNKTATYAQITLDKSQATKASAPKNKVKALDICRNTRANTRFVVDVPADKTVANTKTDLWQTIKRKLPNPRAKTLVSGKTLIIIPDDSKTLEKLRSVPNLKTIGPKQPRIIIYDIDNDLGNIDTYARPGMGSSNIDVTLSTQGAARGVTGWLVSDETDSDHRLLSYKVDLAAPRVRHENKRFDVKREDWDLFAQELARKALTVQSVADKNEHASTLTDAIIAAATKAIPVKAGRRWAICRQPWWTDRLTSMRKLLNRSKRLGLMQNDRPTYNRQRNEYLHEIRRSKMESWKHASEDINVNTWGKAFRYAKNGPRRSNVTRSLTKADGTPTETVDDTMDVLLDTCCVPTIVCA